MTSSPDPAVEPTHLLGTIVRASTAPALAELLAANTAKITRRVPSIDVEVAVGEPFSGSWCHAHRCWSQAADTSRCSDSLGRLDPGPCYLRPTELVTLNVTATGLPMIDGDRAVVGILSTDTTGLTVATSVSDAFDATQYVELAGRCDHCNTTRSRRYTLLTQDSAGTVQALGASCGRELTGSAVRDGVIKLLVELKEATEQFRYGNPPADGQHQPLATVVALADRLIQMHGFVSARNAGKDNPSTRQQVGEALFYRPGKGNPRPELIEQDLTPADLIRAEELIAETAGWDSDDSFAFNLRQLCAQTLIEVGGKRDRLGFAVCIPDAARRAEQRRQQAEERAARRAAEAANAGPVPAGRGPVSGEVIKAEWRNNGFGDVLKLTIKDDRGFRVWGNCPSGLGATPKHGDRISFIATLSPAGDDPQFGFYKIPKNAVLTAQAAAE